jgi:hypothetical protein
MGKALLKKKQEEVKVAPVVQEVVAPPKRRGRPPKVAPAVQEVEPSKQDAKSEVKQEVKPSKVTTLYPPVFNGKKYTYTRLESLTLKEAAEMVQEEGQPLHVFAKEPSRTDGKLTDFVVAFVSSKYVTMIDVNSPTESGDFALGVRMHSGDFLKGEVDEVKFAYYRRSLKADIQEPQEEEVKGKMKRG